MKKKFVMIYSPLNFSKLVKSVLLERENINLYIITWSLACFYIKNRWHGLSGKAKV